jgi:hypothetical protein
MHKIRALCFLFVLILACLPVNGFAALPSYDVTDIGSVLFSSGSTGTYSTAYGVYYNNAGTIDVTGYYQATAPSLTNSGSSATGFLYSVPTSALGTSVGTVANIGTTAVDGGFQPTNNIGMAISSNGLITGLEGDSSNPNSFNANNYRSFASTVTTPSTSTVVAAGYNTQAAGINSSGVVAGQMDFGGTQHAFVAVGSGAPVDLGTANPGGPALTSFAQGINNANQVVGQDTWNGVQQATLWTVSSNGAKLSETNLGAGTTNPSMAKAINNAGNVIVGFAYGTANGVTSYQPSDWILGSGGTWTENFLNLSNLIPQGDMLSSDLGSYSFSVNDDGLIVGQYSLQGSADPSEAFIYATNAVDGFAADTAYDLSSLISDDPFSYLDAAAFITGSDIPGINDAIVGEGVDSKGDTQAFLAWDPSDPVSTPEPATLGLMGLGFLGMAFARRMARSW